MLSLFRLKNRKFSCFSQSFPAWQRLVLLLCGLLCAGSLSAQPGSRNLSYQSGQSGPGERRVALVIGNDNYQQVEKLRNAVNDAEAMARELREVGFEVLLRTNLDRRGIKVAVRDFSKRIAGGGIGVFYFSGHGMQTKTGINLLLPVDLPLPSDERLLLDDAIVLNDVLEDLREAKSRFVLAIIDACRDNPLRNTGARSLGDTRGLSAVSAPEGTMVVFAAGAGQQALDRLGPDDPVRNGLFTREFIAAMRQPNLPVYEVVKLVQKRVAEKAQSVGHVQRPAIYNEASDDFIFRLIVETAAATAVETVQRMQQAKPDPVQEENRFWEDVKTLNTVEGYRDYLDKYPRGRYVTLARGHIQKLSAPAAAPVTSTSAPVLVVPAPAPAVQQTQTAPMLVAPVPLEAAVPGPANRPGNLPAGRKRPGAGNSASEGITGGSGSGMVTATTGQVFRDCPECPEMVVIPGGRFNMGSPDSEAGRYADEGPQHPVSLRRFAMSRFEITSSEWNACVKAGGCSNAFGHPDAPRLPATSISFEDAQEYLRWLSGITGKSYRLPSEAEWEYAARAGSVAPYYWGNDFDSTKAYVGNGVVAVGRYPANPFGLHDMHGNALEWVEDCWHDNYTGAPADGSAWTSDCGRTTHVLRSGAGFFMSKNQRAARRVRDSMMLRNTGSIGLRVVRGL